MRLALGSTDKVAHAFATATRPEEWAEFRAGNVFCDGQGSIYSYGYHYKLGQHLWNAEGEHAVMLNDYNYSSSTVKQRYAVALAANHLNTIDVPHRIMKQGFQSINTEHEEAWLEELQPIVDKCLNKRARIVLTYVKQLMNKLGDVIKFYKFFDKPVPESIEKLTEFLDEGKHPEFWERANKLREAQEARESERWAEAREMQRRLDEEEALHRDEKVGKWRAGDNVTVRPEQRDGKIFYMLRAKEKGDKVMVQTSGGLYIPYTLAKAMFCYIHTTAPAVGDTTMTRLASKIGYQFIGIDGEALTIGCHSFTMEEINNFAKAQGWYGNCGNDDEVTEVLNDIKN